MSIKQVLKEVCDEKEKGVIAPLCPKSKYICN